jgi:hypothetical protein
MVAGYDTSNIRDLMIVETVARLTAALTAAELLSPHVNVSDHNMSPSDIAIHVVNDACKQGRLSFLHTTLTYHKGDSK